MGKDEDRSRSPSPSPSQLEPASDESDSGAADRSPPPPLHAECTRVPRRFALGLLVTGWCLGGWRLNKSGSRAHFQSAVCEHENK